MRNKRILSDADGVLVNWIDGFADWLLETRGQQLQPETEDKHYVEDRIGGVTREEGVALVHEFNRSDYLAKLTPFRDSQKYVKALKDRGYTFHCITKVEDTPECYEMRRQNLTDLFGDAIDELTLTGNQPNKIEHLTRYRDTGRWWIEDSVSNAEDGHRLGLETVLMTNSRTVNFEHDDIHVVRTWAEVYALITTADD